MRNIRLSVLLCLCLALATTAFAQKPSGPPGPVQIGEEMAMSLVSPAFEGSRAPGRTEKTWSQEIRVPGASYVAPHFSRFHLPAKAMLVVRTPDNSRTWTYTGHGKMIGNKPMKEFWGIHGPGDTIIIEIFSEHPIGRGAVQIDKIAHGYPNDLVDKSLSWSHLAKALCGTDDSENAQCYDGTEMYDKARAVARLYINGSSACTGWLIGSEGHLMTNEHCLGSASDAANTDYEFMAEGTCSENCSSWMACPGTVVANSATLIQNDATYDFAMVQLPTNPTGTYGYLQLREDGAVEGERIYIPQHPSAWGKRIASESTASQDPTGYCEVYNTCESGCSGNPCDIGYYCDTQGGSSGSPVLGYDDHCVVSLHHCANCPNRGVPIQDVISQLGGNLPADALCSACSPQATADAGPDKTINEGDSVTLGTTAKSGHSYSWSPGGQTSAQITVSPSTTTTYTVTATTACGTASDSVTVTVLPAGQNGPQEASYDSGLGAPKCAIAGSSCDSLSLLDGRATKGPEPNYPNTLDSCTDGTSGTYHSDESNDRIFVTTLDGVDMVEGATVRIDTTVWAWSSGSSDHADFYYAADANSPSWTFIGTVTPSAGGAQTLSVQYTLPAGALQAVRVNFRYNGSASSCSGGSYDDADDLVFAVKAAAPECTYNSDCDDGLYCNGAEICNAGTCQAGTAVSCHDGISCTLDSCNEATDSCDNTPDDSVCNNGLFCDGAETCSATSGCLAGADPCPGQSCDEANDVCTTPGGDETAVFDASLQAPSCSAVGKSCDSATLLDGRATKGPEPNYPNTIYDSCSDGTSGTYHNDESIDAITVSTNDGSAFAPGKTVTISTTVYAWSTGSSDRLDLYYTADATSPSWTYITTITPPSGGLQTLTATYTLPSGTLQAVRANFRYRGSTSYCSTGSYDDHDDLIFAVNP